MARRLGFPAWPPGTVLVARWLPPVQLAVATGAALSIALSTSSGPAATRSWSSSTSGLMDSSPNGMPPSRLPDRSITVFDVHGSLFFASARKLGQLLPDPEGISIRWSSCACAAPPR